MTDCSKTKDRIYSFVIGECDLDTAEAIRAPIRSCKACTEELKRMREVVRLTGKLEKINPSRDLCREVLAKIHPPYFWLKVAGAAAAAAVLIVVVLYLLVGMPGAVQAPEQDRIVQSRQEPEEIKVVETDDTTPEQLPGKKVITPDQDDDNGALARKKSGSEEEAVPQKEPIREKEEKDNTLVDLPEPEHKEKDVVREAAPAPKSPQPMVIAKVGNVVGDFGVKRKGSKDWLEGEALLSIMPGDTIETNALGQVRIDFETGDYLYVNTNSCVDLADGENVLLVRINKGEVYCEKDSSEGEMSVETGFGEVRTKEARFDVKMFGSSQCLIQVLSGEVNCRESEKKHCGKYSGLTRTWLRRGRRCDKGTKLRSKEGFRWAVKLQPKRENDAGKHAGKPAKPDEPGKHGPGAPPGSAPKPGGQQGAEPGGKVGPGPSPMPPAPGGQGSGNGHGPGGKQGGECPPGGKK